MRLETLLPLLSTVVTFTFAYFVLARYVRRKGLHLLLWGIGLVFYGMGTLSEFVSSLVWSPIFLRLWYIGGALLTAAWLGQGTVYLLVRRRPIPNALLVILILASLFGVYRTLAAPLNPAPFSIYRPLSEQYREIMDTSGALRLTTIFMNIYGTLCLVGGALYSAYLFWRKRVLANRVVGNVLIAAGALMPAAGGTFLALGGVDWLYLSELLGAILMFLGFLRATAPSAVPAASAAQPARG